MSSTKVKPFGTHNLAYAVLTAIVVFPTSGYSFEHHGLHRCAESCSYRNFRLNAFGFSNTPSTIPEENEDKRVASVDRRAMLFAGASVTAGYVLKEKIRMNYAPAILTSSQSSTEMGALESSTVTVASAEEALKIIEEKCDKRFLHAVVASDYKFLYEQSKTIPSDIDVENIFSKKVPLIGNKARSVLLASTGNLGAKKSASLWPLENSFTKDREVHYAWPEQGGVLQPNRQNNYDTVSNGAAQKIIVDGIDCGKMSLEDALEGNMEVLVQSATYLSVPSHMESTLREGLRGAFLI